MGGSDSLLTKTTEGDATRLEMVFETDHLTLFGGARLGQSVSRAKMDFFFFGLGQRL